MSKKIVFNIISITIQIFIFIVLVCIIIKLLNLNEEQSDAKEKLNEAIKIYTSSYEAKLEDIIRNIKGFEQLQINKETGEYNIKIDGQDFIVVSQEIIQEEETADEEKQ